MEYQIKSRRASVGTKDERMTDVTLLIAIDEIPNPIDLKTQQLHSFTNHPNVRCTL